MRKWNKTAVIKEEKNMSQQTQRNEWIYKWSERERSSDDGTAERWFLQGDDGFFADNGNMLKVFIMWES